ncbi:MAG: glycosyltransferase family 4 protein [Chitinophagaceae bacterium]|nr:glycosyltransferase family 4 protein [Chitinophagaceae bacterium]
MKSTKKILFIIPAPKGISPGQRFRFEHYLETLKEQGFSIRLSSFYSRKAWSILYTKGNLIKKIIFVCLGFLRRLFDLLRIHRYSFVYIYREATPIGPPFFEWITTRIFKKKLIYDFDDAIWIPVSSEYNRSVKRIRNFSKVSKICRWAYKVTVGNDFLAQYARSFNNRVIIIPTVVNTIDVHNRLQQQITDSPAVGWTGTFSTLPYLNIVLPVLQQLQEKYHFPFIVISDKDPQLPLKYYRFIKWERENEVRELLQFHIGLMPLYDDDLSRGKCGFKAIQYMSLGIPAVVSPVGVNSQIIDNGINGFLCNHESEWYEKIEYLLNHPEKRKEMGAAAREKIEQYYSVQATKNTFVQLFT